MNPMEFFKGQGRVSIESRDERGEQRPADGTNIVIVLRQAAARVAKSLPALAMGALLTMPLAVPANAEPVNPVAPNDIVRIADKANADLLPLVKYMDPAYFVNVGHIKIHDQADNPDSLDTPYAKNIISFNKVSCEVNMVGMHKVNAVISDAPDKKLDKETASDLRHMVAAHEVAHCEFGFGVMAGYSSNNHNQPYMQSILLLEDIQREIPGLEDMSEDLATTLKERQADSKMLLLVALSNLDPTEGEAGLRDGFENFNRLLSIFKKLREKNNEGWTGYNDHDTSSVVDVIENLAKSAAGSLESARAFQANFNNPAAINDFTVQITVATMIHELPQIIDSLMYDAIVKQNAALSESKNPTTKLNAKKKLVSYKSALDLNQTYKFSVDSPAQKDRLVKPEFLKAVNSTWTTYGPQNEPALNQDDEESETIIAPVMRP